MKKRTLQILTLCTTMLVGTTMATSNESPKVVSSITEVNGGVDPKMEYKYKLPEAIETDDYKITFRMVENQAVFSQVKIKITNKTTDYLVLDLGKITFTVNEKEYKNKSKIKIIFPKDDKNIILKVVDKTAKMQVESFKINIDGITKYSVDAPILEFEKFKLPVSKNTIEKNDFALNVKKIKKETDETIIKFKATYSGDKLILLDASKVVFVKEDGEEFANVHSKSKPELLFSGDNENIELRAEIPVIKKQFDMQFATFYIDWKDSVKELSGVAGKTHAVSFELDVDATNKNK